MTGTQLRRLGKSIAGAIHPVRATTHEENIMLSFLSTYWVWIVLIGAMLLMHRGHGGHGGGHGGGCGGGHAGAEPTANRGHAGHDHAAEHPASSSSTGPVSLDKPPVT